MKKTPPKSLSFGEFTPDVATAGAVTVLSRDDFKGLGPEEAARRLTVFAASRVAMREVTQGQKEMVIRRLLQDLAEKNIDLATATPEVMVAYREWLAKLVASEVISESYAGHIVSQWNAVVRIAFGENGKPGECLLMRGFPMRARQVQRYDESDFQALLSASNRRRYRSPDDKDAFQTYLEIEWSTGGRVGSLTDEGLTFEDVDWDKGTLRLRHMKNRPEHTAILTERALARLRARREYLSKRPYWKGDTTPILAGKSGKPLTTQGINRMLKESAAMAGMRKRTTSHVIRKSVGTLIAKHNPRYAHEQLGITAKVFEMHYNQPMLEDRLERRDILPGAVAGPARTPEEIAGHAWLQYSQGRLSRADFDAAMQRADVLRAKPSVGVPETSAYG